MLNSLQNRSVSSIQCLLGKTHDIIGGNILSCIYIAIGKHLNKATREVRDTKAELAVQLEKEFHLFVRLLLFIVKPGSKENPGKLPTVIS